MSLFAPISAPAPQIAQPRDPVVFASAATRAPVPAVTATLTQNAVQQIKAGARSDMLTTRDVVPTTDKRHRLVGPPPTFQINVLQHMQETRADPPELTPDPEHQPLKADAAGTPESGAPEQPSHLALKNNASSQFQSYQQDTGPTDADTKMTVVNARI